METRNLQYHYALNTSTFRRANQLFISSVGTFDPLSFLCDKQSRQTFVLSIMIIEPIICIFPISLIVCPNKADKFKLILYSLLDLFCARVTRRLDSK